MAVDAHHLLLSPPQLLSNRELVMNNNTVEPTSGGFCTNNETRYGVISPLLVTDDTPPLLHMYGSASTADSFTYYADSLNGDCGIFPLPTRKRSRDYTSNYYHHLLHQNLRSSSVTTPFSFLGQHTGIFSHINQQQHTDIPSHINQQQHEIDRFVSLHMERVKLEMEEKRKKQAKTIMEAIEHGLAKRLRMKEEEKDRIGKLNNALEERVKSLFIENQIWRDLAQTNEATANNLRTNLEQVMTQVKDLRNENAGDDNDDAQSCCGSSSGEGTETAEDKATRGGRMCRNCGEEESCVLLLPCRHLCLCGVCGSCVHTCPICKSPKNASVHINMS